MNKIFLIISREYITRVRKKSFIAMSIIGPLLIAALYAVPFLLAVYNNEEKVIKVVDESGLFIDKFHDSDKITFVFEELSSDFQQVKENFKGSSYDALLYIPDLNIEHPKGISIFSEKGISSLLQNDIENTIEKEIRDIKLKRSGVDVQVLQQLKTNVKINIISLNGGGEEKQSAIAATVVGAFGGILIYMFTFLYGAQVMRGIIEEKSNRIVEVMISSVKPFQLMMGKILGIAGVGLTQILIWVLLGLVITGVITSVVGVDYADLPINKSELIQTQLNQEIQSNPMDSEFVKGLLTIDYVFIVIAFVFYFLFGYLMYAALFGAIGAAVDSETDSQQFMLPVTLPLILSIVMSGAIITEPNGMIAFWMSMIPFTSPVVMMIRLPFIGFSWELLLSMGLLVLGFIATTWVAARIYRVGILMYGKKVTYRELSKWLFFKF
ncbi:ABC transporter permease [Rapidithrix thailandica]|uniref:ABC transporter permease n=1 Tax=Rapidithrix thailandica TaxID=413964 RepID=A0AAW9S2X9_9BACT